MRIRDWSADVCSSDLRRQGQPQQHRCNRPGPRILAVDRRGADAPGVGRLDEPCARPTAGARRTLVSAGYTQPALRAGTCTYRKSVVSGKRGSDRLNTGGARIIKKETKSTNKTT